MDENALGGGLTRFDRVGLALTSRESKGLEHLGVASGRPPPFTPRTGCYSATSLHHLARLYEIEVRVLHGVLQLRKAMDTRPGLDYPSAPCWI
jgi:hypothetical protein